MQIPNLRRTAGLSWSLFQYLRRPLSLEEATLQLRARMEHRSENFLASAKRLIYDYPDSPYRKLLLWADCDYADLESSVRAMGVEKTLEELRDQGVFVNFEEFKSKVPIARKGLTIETSEINFDRPVHDANGLAGTTSGSHSDGTRVRVNWDSLTEQAASEILLRSHHGIGEAPEALWMPAYPSIAGFHNICLHLKFRQPQDKWFSHIEPSAKSRLILLIYLCSRLLGMSAAKPEFTPITDVSRVLEWIQDQLNTGGHAVLKTFTGSAVRIAEKALAGGIDLTGTTIFVGGEPLHEKRSEYITSTGAKVISRYVSTESGLIGAACGGGDAADAMHVYLDRLALIQQKSTIAASGEKVQSFLYSSLSLQAGKVLFNTDLGDFGQLETRACDCLFGKLGMNVWVSKVRSHVKFTGEGMTLHASLLDEIVGDFVKAHGGGPDQYQFWEKQDDRGQTKLVIAVSPEVKELDAHQLVEAILHRLRRYTATNVFAQLWSQASTLEVVRARPVLSKGFKHLLVTKHPERY